MADLFRITFVLVLAVFVITAALSGCAPRQERNIWREMIEAGEL